MKIIGLALIVFGFAAGAACPDYLKTTPDGHSVGIYRVESLRGVGVSLFDASEYVRERRLPSDKLINIFKISDLFSDGRVFMGFGRPNVFLAFPPGVNEKTEWDKFAAKSFRRADSVLEDTRGFVQSGVLVVFKILGDTAARRLYAAAQGREGSRRLTCVRANCEVLADAGFTIGGESPKEYSLPGALLRDILAHGLELEGVPVEFDVIRINPEFMESIGLGIDRAVGTTFCRHGERACAPGPQSGRRLVRARRLGQKLMGFFLEASRDRSLAKSETVVTRLSAPDDRAVSIRVSEPSALATPFRLIWGAHMLYELPVARDTLDRALPDKLKAYPNPHPNFVTRLKKGVLFAPAVVKFLRRRMAAGFREFTDVTPSNLFDMLRTDSAAIPNKYNLVITGDRVTVMKNSIKVKSVDWVLSKHLILSNYVEDVRFAGELFKTEAGEIVINRNSGTYQPTEDQLIHAVEVLSGIFPGTPIVADRSI